MAWQWLLKEAGMMDEKVTLNVTIENLTADQAAEFKRLFAWMNYLGGIGASRSFNVFCDGDGGFRPMIKVEGEEIRPEEADKDEGSESNYEDIHFGFE